MPPRGGGLHSSRRRQDRPAPAAALQVTSARVQNQCRGFFIAVLPARQGFRDKGGEGADIRRSMEACRVFSARHTGRMPWRRCRPCRKAFFIGDNVSFIHGRIQRTRSTLVAPNQHMRPLPTVGGARARRPARSVAGPAKQRHESRGAIANENYLAWGFSPR